MSIPQKYLAAAQDANRRLEAGDAKGAIQAAMPVVQALPNYPEIHVVLGRSFRLLGETEKSLARFRSAAELAPKDAARWGEFIDALLKDGQKGRARKVAQKAPLKGPQKKQLLDLARKGSGPSGPALGGADQADLTALQTMIQSGKMDEAKRRAETLLKAHPDSAFLHNILGIVSLSRGEGKKAEERFRKTLELSPQFAGAAANLGLALTGQRQFDAAIEVLRRAATYEPRSIEVRTNLANAYLEAGWHKQAYDEATDLLKLAKNDADVLMIRASAAVELQLHAEALDVLELIESVAGVSEWSLTMRFRALAEGDKPDEAVALAEKHIEVASGLLVPLARLKTELGQPDEARALLRDAIKDGTVLTSAYYLYSRSKRWSSDDPMLATLENAAERVDRNEIPRGEFVYYGLAKAYGDLGDDQKEFAAARAANKLHGANTVFSAHGQEAERFSIENKWTAETFERMQGAGVDSVAPIFVVGMPRSGSTLIEHVIVAHPKVSSVGEDSFTFPFFPQTMPAERNALIEAAKDAAKEVRRLSGPEGHLLDKYLYNFQRLGALAAAFPNAKFIQTQRDPRAVALSIFLNPMKAAGHPYSMRLEDIAHYYIFYHKLMEHWRSFLGDRIIVADYQKLVEDPEPQIRDMIARLELPWDDACLKPEAVQKRVKTLSVVQVRSGIHSNSVERWKRHEDRLQPFTRILVEEGLL